MLDSLKKLLRGNPPPPRMLEPGRPAPDFSVRAHDGTTVRLTDLRGRKILLWFYPKADTPGCTLEGKGLCDVNERLERSGAVVLGASFDDVAANRAFAEKFSFPFRLLCDTDRSLGLAYGACDSASAKHARRISYLIDENGVVRHALATVDPATHSAEILALLNA